MHYKGTLIDGTQFDSSYDRGQAASFPLNGVVPGFGEGLTKVGKVEKSSYTFQVLWATVIILEQVAPLAQETRLFLSVS